MHVYRISAAPIDLTTWVGWLTVSLPTTLGSMIAGKSSSEVEWHAYCRSYHNLQYEARRALRVSPLMTTTRAALRERLKSSLFGSSPKAGYLVRWCIVAHSLHDDITAEYLLAVPDSGLISVAEPVCVDVGAVLPKPDLFRSAANMLVVE